MANPAAFSPTAYDISKCLISTYDRGTTKSFAEIIYAIKIEQSMEAASWYGEFDVLDNVGLLQDMPLRGEEFVDLELYTYDTKERVKIRGRVWSISNIVPTPTMDGVAYKISFVSETSFAMMQRKITAPFKNSTSNIARDIFSQYISTIRDYQSRDTDNRPLPLAGRRYPLISYRQKNFYVQPTGTISDIIIPNVSPAKAMNMVAGRSWSGDETPSQTFRFFETLDGYYFCSDEWIILKEKDNAVELTHSPVLSLKPSNVEEQIAHIDDLQIPKRGTDTHSDIESGGYTSKALEIDFQRRRVIKKEFNYVKDGKFLDMNGEVRKIRETPHSSQFMNDTFTKENAKEFIIYKTYASDGDIAGSLKDEEHMGDIAIARSAYKHHLHNTMVIASMKGRLDLRPGKVVQLNLKEFVPDKLKNFNNEVSGRYIIKGTTHKFDKGQLQTQMSLAKFNWSK